MSQPIKVDFLLNCAIYFSLFCWSGCLKVCAVLCSLLYIYIYMRLRNAAESKEALDLMGYFNCTQTIFFNPTNNHKNVIKILITID